MNKIIALAIFISTFTFANCQDNHSLTNTKTIPSVQLKDIEGNMVNTSALGIEGPIIFSFWATWCSPCKRELNAINDVYVDWQEETGVTLVAVSIDDEKTINQVPLYVNGKA